MLIPNISSTAQAPQLTRVTGESAGTEATQGAPLVDVTAAKQKPAEEKQPSPVQLKTAMDSLNKTLQESNKNIQFSVDTDSHRTVVKLMDTETGDTIRQYPTKEALAISKSIDTFQQGLLLKQKA